MKAYMDKFIAEGVLNNEGNWDLRKDDKLIKVWTRYDGTEFNDEQPLLRTEHYFPDIDDPEIILKSLLKIII